MNQPKIDAEQREAVEKVARFLVRFGMAVPAVVSSSAPRQDGGASRKKMVRTHEVGVRLAPRAQEKGHAGPVRRGQVRQREKGRLGLSPGRPIDLTSDPRASMAEGRPTSTPVDRAAHRTPGSESFTGRLRAGRAEEERALSGSPTTAEGTESVRAGAHERQYPGRAARGEGEDFGHRQPAVKHSAVARGPPLGGSSSGRVGRRRLTGGSWLGEGPPRVPNQEKVMRSWPAPGQPLQRSSASRRR